VKKEEAGHDDDESASEWCWVVEGKAKSGHGQGQTTYTSTNSTLSLSWTEPWQGLEEGKTQSPHTQEEAASAVQSRRRRRLSRCSLLAHYRNATAQRPRL